MTVPSRPLQAGFGSVIRRRRVALGISQEELADKCGLHRTYISEIERGLKSASLKAITLIAEALETRPYVLLEEAESEPSNHVQNLSHRRR